MISTTDMGLILASSSPRRKKILGELGFEFDIKVPDIDEDCLPGETPENHVMRLSRVKAESIADVFKDDLVVGADTIVVFENKFVGKPSSPEQAVEMLAMLSGNTHAVYSGLSLAARNSGYNKSGFDRTEVSFYDLDYERILEYVDTGEPLDKAGAYGIQGMGSFLVREYQGELDTVIGFPSKLFEKMYLEALSCLNL